MESWSVNLLQCCLSGFGGRPVFCYGVTFSWLQVAEENKQNKTTHCLMKGAHQNQGRGILSPMAVPQCPLSIKFNILPASTVEIFIAPFIFFFKSSNIRWIWIWESISWQMTVSTYLDTQLLYVPLYILLSFCTLIQYLYISTMR